MMMIKISGTTSEKKNTRLYQIRFDLVSQRMTHLYIMLSGFNDECKSLINEECS
jgi:hypothetical protein